MVGRVGIDPWYFLNELDPTTSADIIIEHEQCERDAWERARWQTYHTLLPNLGKHPKPMQVVFPFPWDKKSLPQVKITKEEKLRLKSFLNQIH